MTHLSSDTTTVIRKVKRIKVAVWEKIDVYESMLIDLSPHDPSEVEWTEGIPYRVTII